MDVVLRVVDRSVVKIDEDDMTRLALVLRDVEAAGGAEDDVTWLTLVICDVELAAEGT